MAPEWLTCGRMRVGRYLCARRRSLYYIIITTGTIGAAAPPTHPHGFCFVPLGHTPTDIKRFRVVGDGRARCVSRINKNPVVLG